MASWKIYLACACMVILSLGVANGLEDKHEEQRERAEMLSNVGRDMHRHLHDAQEYRRGMQGPGARHLMRNAEHDEVAMAGMGHPAERDFADKEQMRRAAEEMGRLHHRHMDERTAHAMREAHAAHNSFAAEGGHADRAAMRHKAAMENMGRNVRQDRHLPGHEHLIPEGHIERGPAAVEGARAAAREAHRDALLDDKARMSKERMSEIMKMHPHGSKHDGHVDGHMRPNGGGGHRM